MTYLGDYAEDYATLNFKFTTRQFSTGAPFTLAGTPVVKVYKGSSTTTESTAGITLSVDFDGVTGLNNVLIDLSADAFYAVGEDYAIVITTGTVDSVSVVGETIATFSIENRHEEVDVTKWLGSAVAAVTNAGVPEVDVTHWTGVATSLSATSALPEVDAKSISDDATAANNAEAFFTGTEVADIADGVWDEATLGHTSAGTTGKALTDVDTDTTTILTDTNELQADWTNGGRLDLIIDAILVDTGTTIPGTITTLNSGQSTTDGLITTVDANLKGYFQIALRSDAAIATDGAALLTAINADEGSGAGNYDNTTESVEALRDRGDAAWITATGFSTHTAANVRTEMDSNSTQLAAIVADTNELQTDWADGGRLDLLVDAILLDTGTTIPGTITTIDTVVDGLATTLGVAGAGLTDLGGMSTTMKGQINTEVDGAWTTAIADSVSTDGSLPTREQALYLVNQMLTEFAISGTTYTVKKVDGSTTLATFTLSDATNPTSITRAT